MPSNLDYSAPAAQSDFVVPGTCVSVRAAAAGRRSDPGTYRRDPAARNLYASAALADIPRLLGAVDRNLYRATYGCLDRQYWHYRTSSFPSEMYQEGVLPLALIHATKLPGNRWFGNTRVRELAIAGMRFSARMSHADGSCDDYYPFERALGAAVFSLQAAARAYQLLQLDDSELIACFERRARWLIDHDESGRLSNHQAMAALGLLRVAQITEDTRYRKAAQDRIERVLAWQSDEGWFEEYGGADPGYQTVTIDCLAKYQKLAEDRRLDEPLGRAVEFARLFLHPDHSFGGEYGSRGTFHFYPHGMELLAGQNPLAADLADGFLDSLARGSQAHFSDDRMFAHRLGNLIEAFVDWTPVRPTAAAVEQEASTRYLRKAQMLVRRVSTQHTVISAARGGVFKHFASNKAAVTDAGLIVETSGGRVAVSQWHDPDRSIELLGNDEASGGENSDAKPDDSTIRCMTVSGPLYWTRFETATPLKQALLHTGMCSLGRHCRTLVRRVLQRRLITGRRKCPILLSRCFEFVADGQTKDGPSLRVADSISLTSSRIRIHRMGYGTDHQVAYTAASGVYQEGVLAPWIDLADHVEELNARRQVTVVREI